jgi:hypothetical protein
VRRGERGCRVWLAEQLTGTVGTECQLYVEKGDTTWLNAWFSHTCSFTYHFIDEVADDLNSFRNIQGVCHVFKTAVLVIHVKLILTTNYNFCNSLVML